MSIRNTHNSDILEFCSCSLLGDKEGNKKYCKYTFYSLI